MLLSAVLLQIGMLCPLLTVTPALHREESLSWYALLKTANGITEVIGGVNAAQNGAFWVTVAVAVLEFGIVLLGVCGVLTMHTPSHGKCACGAIGGGMVFAVTAIGAYVIYDTLHSFPFRAYRSSVDMEPTWWVMLAVSAAAVLIGAGGVRCFKIKERAT